MARSPRDDVEVVHQSSLGIDRLRPHAAPRPAQILGTQLGHQALQVVDEDALQQRPPDLVGAGAPEAGGEAPEARPGGDARRVAQRDVAPAVALALQGQHGVRPGLDAAVYHQGQVHSQEGKAGIGHGIDKAADEAPPLGRQLVVLAAEGQDAQSRIGATEAGHAIGLETGAVDQERRPRRRREPSPPPDRRRPDAHPGRGRPSPPGRPDSRCVGRRRGPLPDSRRCPSPARGGREAGGVRLETADLLRSDAAHALKAVGRSPPLQLVETRQLLGIGGDDQLAAALVGDSLLGAEAVERPCALDAEPRLEGARLVVEAGVDDAAVVAALVGGDAILPLPAPPPSGPGRRAPWPCPSLPSRHRRWRRRRSRRARS